MAPAKKRLHKSSPSNGSTSKKAKPDQVPVVPAALDLTDSPKKLFESLILPVSFDDFFEKHWETEPVLIHRTDPSISAYYESLFNKTLFLELARTNELEFATDVNVVQYKDGARINMNLAGQATPAKIQKLFAKGGTFQIHQPQRFQEKLWQILEKLESFFGCLVGSNVYMTPPGCQGLPPHYDDVEVFILQLEGQKHWRLYKPLVELPMEYSRDLGWDEIGEPTHDFVLKPGDLLYFPRGTIHQAVASEGSTYSTHITVSTYQQQTWGNYLLSIFPSLIEDAMATDVRFRKGLPLNFLKSSKLAKSDKMNSVAQMLLQKLQYSRFLSPDNMVEDFMSSRLPPYGVNSEELQSMVPEGFPPDVTSKVKLSYPDHICFHVKKELPMDEDDGDSDDDDEEESSSETENDKVSENTGSKSSKLSEMLYVYSSLFNDNKIHMMGTEFEDGDSKKPQACTLKFAGHFLGAMEQLKTSAEKFISLKELQGINDDEAKTLAYTLWANHLLQVEQSDNKKKSLKVD